jgi:hypothetical protein
VTRGIHSLNEQLLIIGMCGTNIIHVPKWHGQSCKMTTACDAARAPKGVARRHDHRVRGCAFC